MPFDTGWFNQIFSITKFDLGIRVSIWNLNSGVKSQDLWLCTQLSMTEYERNQTAKAKHEDFNKNNKPRMKRHKQFMSPCYILALEFSETGLFIVLLKFIGVILVNKTI